MKQMKSRLTWPSSAMAQAALICCSLFRVPTALRSTAAALVSRAASGLASRVAKPQSAASRSWGASPLPSLEVSALDRDPSVAASALECIWRSMQHSSHVMCASLCLCAC